jgi:copper(I)-binding protein
MTRFIGDGGSRRVRARGLQFVCSPHLRRAPNDDRKYMNALPKGLVLFCSAMVLGFAVAGAQQAPNPGNIRILPGQQPAPAAGAHPDPAPAPAVAPAANAAGPKIQFASTLYDFGRVRAGDPVKHTYVFTNTGCATLILTNVQPQCGCTTAGEWSKQVEPGKTGSIPIQFNTASYSTPVFKQITVICNDKSQQAVFLQLKGVVYKPLDVIPTMAFLNLPPDADGGSVTVTITNHTDEPLVLWGAASNNKLFTAELKTNTPGKAYQLVVSAVPPLGSPVMQAQISVKTSWTNQPLLNVPVYANMQPVLSVIPSIISLPPSPLATAQTSSVTIQNHSASPLSLTNAAVNAPGVEVHIQEMQPGRMFTALATFPEGFELQPGQQVELKMESSNPKYPVVKVPIIQRPRLAMPARLAKPPAPAPVSPRPAPLRPVKTTAADLPPVPDVPTAR